jgi:hypothetical protein
VVIQLNRVKRLSHNCTAVSTFVAYEVLDYDTFMFYTALCSLLALGLSGHFLSRFY